MSDLNSESRERIEKLFNSSLYGKIKKITYYNLLIISELYDENDEYVKELDRGYSDGLMYSEEEINGMVIGIKEKLEDANKNGIAEEDKENCVEHKNYDYIDCHVYVDYRSANTAIIYAQIKAKQIVE